MCSNFCGIYVTLPTTQIIVYLSNEMKYPYFSKRSFDPSVNAYNICLDVFITKNNATSSSFDEEQGRLIVRQNDKTSVEVKIALVKIKNTLLMVVGQN